VPLLRRLLGSLERPYVVLGNHDVAVTRDPFSRAAELDGIEEQAVLLLDDAAVVELSGARIQLVGTDAERFPKGTAEPWKLADPAVDLRILLCHFPDIDRTLPAGAFHLVLAGHLHAGQIAIPLPTRRRRLTLAHPRERYVAGLYAVAGGVMHISPGTGTTFVPLRFFARPEVTELVLRSSATASRQRA
jgi:predicted MPP superfamily phosphohydrolase